MADDLELALSLHRELNGLTRRSRQPSRNYDGALQRLASKKQRGRAGSESEPRPSTTSSGSGSKRRSGGREEESRQLKKLKSLGETSSEGGSDLSDPSSSPQASRPREDQQQQQAAAVAAAAVQARGKAAKAPPPAHIKCFFAGVRWGTLLPLGALKDRASLVAAVSKAFEQDGVRCSEASAHVVFVTADQQALEFPGCLKLGGGNELPRPGEWDEAAQRAVRIYVR